MNSLRDEKTLRICSRKAAAEAQLLEGFTREEIIELTGMLERMLGNLRDVPALEDD